jgi:hypothetical protein
MTSLLLTFFQICVLLDEFFLAIPGKADREFGLIAGSLPAQHQAPAILCMPDIGAGNDVHVGSRGLRSTPPRGPGYP